MASVKQNCCCNALDVTCIKFKAWIECNVWGGIYNGCAIYQSDHPSNFFKYWTEPKFYGADPSYGRPFPYNESIDHILGLGCVSTVPMTAADRDNYISNPVYNRLIFETTCEARYLIVDRYANPYFQGGFDSIEYQGNTTILTATRYINRLIRHWYYSVYNGGAAMDYPPCCHDWSESTIIKGKLEVANYSRSFSYVYHYDFSAPYDYLGAFEWKETTPVIFKIIIPAKMTSLAQWNTLKYLATATVTFNFTELVRDKYTIGTTLCKSQDNSAIFVPVRYKVGGNRVISATFQNAPEVVPGILYDTGLFMADLDDKALIVQGWSASGSPPCTYPGTGCHGLYSSEYPPYITNGVWPTPQSSFYMTVGVW